MTKTTTHKAKAFQSMKSVNSKATPKGVSANSKFDCGPTETSLPPVVQSQAGPEKALLIKASPTKSTHQRLADVSMSPITSNAATAQVWAQQTFGEIGLNESVALFQERATLASSGDLTDAKQMLMAQASALDTIFSDLARRASRCMADTLSDTKMAAADAYLRMAFKAQGQCRNTLQTLGELVNPRSVAFIKQANMANGPQQVNNGEQCLTPAEKCAPTPNKLLESEDGQCSSGMDAGATTATVRSDQKLEAVEAFDRTEKRRRKARSFA